MKKSTQLVSLLILLAAALGATALCARMLVSSKVEADAAYLKSQVQTLIVLSDSVLKPLREVKVEQNQNPNLIMTADLQGDELGESQLWSDETKGWIYSYLQLLIKNIKPQSHAILLSPERKPFLVYRNNQKPNQIQVMNQAPLQKIFDSLIGQEAQFFIVGLDGVVLAHVQSEYVGSRFDADPLFEKIRNLDFLPSADVMEGDTPSQFYFQKSIDGGYLVLGTLPLRGFNALPISELFYLALFFFGVTVVAFAVMKSGAGENAPDLKFDGKAVNTTGPMSAAKAAAPPNNSNPENREASHQKMSQLIGNQINPPIASAISLIQIALKTVEPKELKELLVRTDRELLKVSSLLKKLILYSGEVSGARTKENLDQLIRRVLLEMDGRIQEKKIQLIDRIQSVPEVTVHRGALLKAIEAVIQNAIEAMDRTVQKNLIIDLSSDGKRIVLSVEDSGEGIGKEVLPKIFQPFYSTKKVGTHQGLGLSMSLAVLNDLDGDIEIQSEIGKGTQVRLSIPLKDSVVSPVSPGMMRGLPAAATAPLPSAPRSAKFEIKDLPPELVVDPAVEKVLEEDPMALPETSETHPENFSAPSEKTSAEKTKAEPPPPQKRFSSKIDSPNFNWERPKTPSEEVDE